MGNIPDQPSSTDEGKKHEIEEDDIAEGSDAPDDEEDEDDEESE